MIINYSTITVVIHFIIPVVIRFIIPVVNHLIKPKIRWNIIWNKRQSLFIAKYLLIKHENLTILE